MRVASILGVLLLALGGSPALLPGQVTPGVVPAEEDVRRTLEFKTFTDEEARTMEFTESYRLLPGDQVRVSVRELTQSYPQDALIGADGSLTLPLAGRVIVAGLTVNEAQVQVAKEFKRMIHDPHVGITVLRSARVVPISVLGAVANPGMYQLSGPRTVLEAIALAGGISQDAGYRIRVSRPVEQGPLEVEGARKDESGAYTMVDIPLLELTEGLNPALNFEVGAHDVISVPRGKMVYVIGAVRRGGGFVLAERQEMSVLELLALAGGLESTAAQKRVTILRPQSGGARRSEIPVNVKDLLKREGDEIYLQSNDILLVPESGSKKAASLLARSVMGGLPTVLLWRLR